MPKDVTSRTDAVARIASGAGLLASCLPMVAMLPGVAGSVVGGVGQVLAGRLLVATVVAGAAVIAFVVITSNGPGAGMSMSVHG